ncbi:response regulator [Inquilinus limosus]|uniref:Transcriptional regulator n=1 Tax=Inquilinus limosus MP06 TaxID=1398085 RepID=A0A0A0D6X8_9PROT|nr:response regulator transcription factor [Inquilinus limosus]KGM34401.1 transcriptional regulator [Inquilinus limosus MP06]
MRVLLVEDEPEMAAVLAAALAVRDFVVDRAASLAEAEAAARCAEYRAIIADRRLPDGDGLSLVRALRRSGMAVPVIMLTARGDVGDRVSGLEAGADDYLAKPFAFEELLARLRAVLRRPPEARPDFARLGRLEFDLGHREALVDGRPLPLRRRELAILEALIQRRERAVLRETLESAVYGLDDEIQSNSLDAHMSRLRRKLAEADAGVEIRSIRGVGYLLRTTS